MNDLKTPPNNAEAERAVLGSILLDTTGRSEDRIMDLCLTSGIRPETFYDPRNRSVYQTMLDMNRNLVPRHEKQELSNNLMTAAGELRDAPIYVDDTAGLDIMDLRDSGAIEQDADVVFLLRRPSRNSQDPESADEQLAIIDVAKNRNGEIGEVRANFVREYTRFEDRPLPVGDVPEGFQTSEPPPTHPEYVQDPLS